MNAKKAHVYMPCDDLCTTLDFYYYDDGFICFNMMQTVSVQPSFLTRLRYAWEILTGKNPCFAEVVCQDKSAVRAFLTRCIDTLKDGGDGE